MAKVNRGFTLIELMIVVLIVGLMLLVAAPFTRTWTDSAKLTEAKGILTQAVGVAKASALRNPAGAHRKGVMILGVSTMVTGTAAAVCIDDSTNKIKVLEATIAASAECPSTGRVIWQANLPIGVAVVGELVAGTDTNIDCLSFSNRAFNLSVGGACALTSELSLKIPKTGAVRDAIAPSFY